MNATGEVSGVIVLRPKRRRNGENKRFDIIRVESSGDVHAALEGLPEEEHVVVDLNKFETYRPEYVVVQKNHKVS